MKKKYIYSSLTIENKSFFKRLTHNKRFEKALNLVEISDTDSILDFGTGDGYFLNLIKSKKKVKITGYEPVVEMFEQLEKNIDDREIRLISNLNQAKEEKFTIVYCLEVLEHFREKNQQKFLQNIKRILDKNGLIVVSVPIEVGIGSFFKNTIRVLIRQFERDTSLVNIFKALFFRPVKREEENDYILSHIGFNYKKLEKTFIKENLQIVQKEYSPFNFLGSLNSQVFYVLKKHQ